MEIPVGRRPRWQGSPVLGAAVLLVCALAAFVVLRQRGWPPRLASGTVVVVLMPVLVSWLTLRNHSSRSQFVSMWIAALVVFGPGIWHSYQGVRAGAHARRAEDLRTAGRSGDAVAALDEALRIQPNRPEYLLRRGRLRRELGDASGALADCDAAAAASSDGPSRSRALQSRGSLRHAQGQYQAAIEDYTLALQDAEDPASMLSARALAWSAEGDQAQARSDCDQALAQDPSSADADAARASVSIAQVHYRLGAMERYAADNQEALRLQAERSRSTL